jgi:hypothetical protein
MPKRVEMFYSVHHLRIFCGWRKSPQRSVRPQQKMEPDKGLGSIKITRELHHD